VVNRTAPNRIDRRGTGEQAWRAWPGLWKLPLAGLLAWPSAVVVAAHPDDEVLGVGGTLALLAAAGARLRVIAVTDGEASHPGAADPAALVRRRAQERAAALAILGVGHVEVVRLGFPDTALGRVEGEVVSALREACRGFEVCLAPWDADAHADHEAAGRAAQQASRRVLSYPVWAWHWAVPADRRLPWHRALRVELPPTLAARKRSAIQAFTSQLTDRAGGHGPVLPPGIVAHFTRAQEVLFA
jgi:LmbE family N-acetylglucosaminyl deacetylase